MTGGIGFTSMMKSLLKTNRSFLKHPDKVRSQKDNLTYLTDNNALNFKIPSDKELEEFKSRVRQERKIEQRKELFILIITLLVIITIALIIYVLIKK